MKRNYLNIKSNDNNETNMIVGSNSSLKLTNRGSIRRQSDSQQIEKMSSFLNNSTTSKNLFNSNHKNKSFSPNHVVYPQNNAINSQNNVNCPQNNIICPQGNIKTRKH